MNPPKGQKLLVTLCYKYYIIIMATPGGHPLDYDKLKNIFMEVGPAIPGSIHQFFAKCGSKKCPCATDKTKLHGPFYRWCRRVNGKLAVSGIPEKNLATFRRWIINRGVIELIIESLLEDGAGHAEAFLESRRRKK